MSRESDLQKLAAFQRQRTVTEVLLAQLRALLVQTPAHDTRRQGAQLMRQLAVAVMSQSPGNSIEVNGVAIETFASVGAKQAYLNKMSQNGAWLDDTCMKSLAVALDVNLRVHVVDSRVKGGTESLISYSLNDAVAADRPQVDLVNYGGHCTAEKRGAGVHWESAVAVAAAGETRQRVQALSTPADGNCGAYAVFDAFLAQQRKQPLSNLAEHYEAKTAEVIVNEDSKLIRQHTAQAEQLLMTAINQHGVGFDELLSIAKQLAALKHGENDTYLQGHIDRLVAGPHHMGATLELGHVMAVRAGIDGDLFKALNSGLNKFKAQTKQQQQMVPQVLATGSGLFASTSQESVVRQPDHSVKVSV